MKRLLEVLNFLERGIACIGFLSALTILPAMIGIRVYEIIARKIFDTALSLPLYLEWELFVFLVFLTLGYAHVHNAHVRVDILRERLSKTSQRRIEEIGLLLFVIPFTIVVLIYGIYYAADSFKDNEELALALGEPWRWLLKGAVPLGFGLFLAASIITVLRNLIRRSGGN